MMLAPAMVGQTDASTQLEPTRKFEYGGVHVHLFGKGAPLRRTMDMETQRMLALHVVGKGVGNIFAINGQEFNAKVIRPLPVHYRSEKGFGGHSIHHSLNFFFGALADGIVGLTDGDGFFYRTADCPTVLITNGDIFSALHAGKDSLIDKNWDSRSCRPSVIQNGIWVMNADPSEMSAFILCGIGPSSYHCTDDHPRYGPKNRQLREMVARRYGSRCIRETREGPSLSLPDLISSELLRCGLREDRIFYDDIDTARELAPDGVSHLWASAHRGDRDRNGILVFRPRRSVR